MGWFDEQIKERRQYDDDAFSEAFANMASAVMGKRFEARSPATAPLPRTRSTKY